MKKIYKIALISAICVALLLCCTLSVFADTAPVVSVVHEGRNWYSVNVVDRYIFNFDGSFRQFDYYNMPYAQGYFPSSNSSPHTMEVRTFFNLNNGGASIYSSTDNFIQFDFVFYVTYKMSSSGDAYPVQLNSTKSNIRADISYYFYNDEVVNGNTSNSTTLGIQGLTVTQELGSDGRLYNHARGFIHNDSNREINFDMFRFTLDSNYNPYSYYVQMTHAYFRGVSESEFIQDYIVPNVDNSSDVNNAKNDIINSIESSTNEVTSQVYLTGDMLYDKIDELRSELESSNSESTNQIKDEIQAGSNQVTDKLDETTDKILNGYESAPVAPSGSSDVSDLGNLESGLQDSASAGIESADEMVTDLGTPMASMLPGFTFFIAMTDRFMQFEWLNTILVVALSLGIVAFLLNISGQILKKVSNGSSSERRSGNSKGKGD